MSQQGYRRLKPKPLEYRWIATVSLIILIFFYVVARAAWVQVVNAEWLQSEADKRSIRLLSRGAERGLILDRNGEALAVSVPVMAAYADPKAVRDGNGFADEARWDALAKVLELDTNTLLNSVQNNSGRFMYIKRQISPAVAEYITKLQIPGIRIQPESRRYYPAGEAVSQLVGITNIDEEGIEGIERTYNQHLTGSPTLERVRQALRGEIVENMVVVKEGEKPQDLTLTLDMRLQSFAYTTLKKATAYHMATSASLVLIDIPTGEILAMANTPSYNSNSRTGIQAYQMRNRAITDAYEPGSVMKPLVVAAVLEKGLHRYDDQINTSPGFMRLRGGTVRDSSNLGTASIGSLLVRSSNMGMAKMALTMPVQELVDFYSAFGFGQHTGIYLEGESAGYLPMRSRWSQHEQATLSFGYGLMATPLQVARMYATLGAGGISYPSTIIKSDQPPVGVRVLSEETANHVIEMLKGVPRQGGTAARAAVDGYEVAGKTGTSRKAIAGGYGADYVATFAGIAPANNPRLAMAVVINEPKGDQYYAGVVAAPVFSEVMAGALKMLNIEPTIAASARSTGT
ncbi:MAG: penicillin-binding transpeptidase domain-containing protein [Ferrimonas sp.]